MKAPRQGTVKRLDAVVEMTLGILLSRLRRESS